MASFKLVSLAGGTNLPVNHSDILVTDFRARSQTPLAKHLLLLHLSLVSIKKTNK